MAFNPKYSSIPMVSNDLGINDLPIVFPNGETISQSGQGSTFTDLKAVKKGGAKTPSLILPNTRYSLSIDEDYIQLDIEVDNVWMKTLPFKVEPSVYDKEGWCKVSAWDSAYYNYSSYPLVVYFRCKTRRQDEVLVPVKYDDKVGVVIPLQLKTYETITFTTQPMNSTLAKLLVEISEWENVKFSYWQSGSWQNVNVVKTAENWTQTTYPRTLGVVVGGSFVVKP